MIHKDIKKAHTLASDFYLSNETYQAILQNAFLPSWQLIDPFLSQGDTLNCKPFVLLEKSIEEPLLLNREQNLEVCVSNVCTHRAMIILEKAQNLKSIRCPYHGRCFHLNGQFKSMPEFEETENFPSKEDNLKSFPLAQWGPLRFVSLNPEQEFKSYFAFIKDRIDWYPINQLSFEPILCKDYKVNAHWALYCDNFLEGFHVPFVHEQLNKILDYGQYKIEVFENGVLQTGIAKDNEYMLDIPEEHPDFGQSIYAYYFFAFPNLMINFYHWGISVNLIEPKAKNKCRVRFFTYLLKGKTVVDFEGTGIHNTEMEDEYVVEAVQKGLQSSSYHRGRFSPNQEKGVHHFHRWLSNCL